MTTHSINVRAVTNALTESHKKEIELLQQKLQAAEINIRWIKITLQLNTGKSDKDKIETALEIAQETLDIIQEGK